QLGQAARRRRHPVPARPAGHPPAARAGPRWSPPCRQEQRQQDVRSGTRWFGRSGYLPPRHHPCQRQVRGDPAGPALHAGPLAGHPGTPPRPRGRRHRPRHGRLMAARHAARSRSVPLTSGRVGPCAATQLDPRYLPPQDGAENSGRDHSPQGDVESATLATDGSPPATTNHLSDEPRPLPRQIERVPVSIASPLVLRSPNGRTVGIRLVTFEACSGFTRVTARGSRLPLSQGSDPAGYPAKPPDLSTIVWVRYS